MSLPEVVVNRGALSDAQVQAYRAGGILHPLPAITADEAARLQMLHASQASLLKGRFNKKPHLLFTWLDTLVRDARILDPIQSLLGPDLLCWSSQFFAKPAGDAAYVSWHQDATYWGLSSNDVVTAWVALTPSTRESGCMQVVPATHHTQVPHEDRFDAANMLTRGQEIAVRVDPAQVVDVVLQPGQMSLHHVLLFHGSQANRSAGPRVGFAIRYAPTHLRQLSPLPDSALLVRGHDRFHHFEAERSPQADLHPDALAHHAEVAERSMKILYAGARERGKLGDNEATR